MKKVLIIGFFLLSVPVFVVVFTLQQSFVHIRSFVILSGSMQPTLSLGSVVITAPFDTYSIGDIIAFTRNGVTVTHRISKKEVAANVFYFQTKGDANTVADEKKITQSTIIGKEIVSIPLIGRLIVFIKTLPGFFCV